MVAIVRDSTGWRTCQAHERPRPQEGNRIHAIEVEAAAVAGVRDGGVVVGLEGEEEGMDLDDARSEDEEEAEEQ